MIIITKLAVKEYIGGLALNLPAAFEKENFAAKVAMACANDKPLYFPTSKEAVQHYHDLLKAVTEKWNSGHYDQSKMIVGGIDKMAEFKKRVLPELNKVVRQLAEELQTLNTSEPCTSKEETNC